jgi:hypothetical protein
MTNVVGFIMYNLCLKILSYRCRNQTGFEKYMNLIKGIKYTIFMLIKYFENQNLAITHDCVFVL